MPAILISQESLRIIFKIGEIIASGGSRAKLKIIAIDRDHVDVQPLNARSNRKLPMEYLRAIHDHYDLIDPKRVQKSIQQTFHLHGLKDETWRENYMYGFIREFRKRAQLLESESILPEELPQNVVLTEGAKKSIVVNAYERSSEAREQCITRWGLNCSVCGMNFSEMYGEIGLGYIHVHHIVPLSQVGTTYRIDPIHDLRPVCPNCHAMLHRGNKVLSIEELRNFLRNKHYPRPSTS